MSTMNSIFPHLLTVAAATAVFTGCSFLKPATSTARFFVLTPLASTGAVAAASSASLALGVGKVKLPDYLFNTSLAVRKGASEIEYSPSILWAERLDTGFQRVLAANLANVLATDRVQLSTWQSAAVSAEVYVTIEQFDVDSAGRGVLVARWRLLAPGGDKPLAAGETRLTRAGPPPGSDPAGAVATLSGLLEEMSRQLAQTIRSAGALPHAVSK